ncbi:sensor histidine kinase [Agrococcus versicolor]|uniref:Sensor histidine kinase n=1 Tax=Agrococcus versicolor TaxID=501482 RepID=A0ABN3AQK8_9MICO
MDPAIVTSGPTPARTDPTRPTRWADLAVVAMVVLVGALLWIVPLPPDRVAIGTAALVLLVVVWAAMRRSLDVGLAGSAWRIAALCVVGLACTLAAPWLAIVQAMLHPLVWLGAARRRVGIVGSGLLCAAVGVGWIARDPADWWIAVAVQVGSWGFSAWFGLWIASIDRLSTERQLLVEALQATRDEVAALATEHGASQERDRIAREIHDTIAQDLAGVVMLLEGVRERATGRDADDLSRAEQAARRSLGDARALVAGEIAIDVDDRGLAPTVVQVAERWSRESGLDVVLEVEQTTLGREAQVVLVRALQEALSNVRRHAGGTRARVALRTTGDDVVLEVDDDGVGIPADRSAHGGFGLGAMERRAALAGGTATTGRSPLGGARVEVRVPTDHASEVRT